MVTGGLGVDYILGGSSGDTLIGGEGNDFILGDGGYITRNSQAIVVIIRSLDESTGGNDVIDQAGSAGADVIFGGAGDDQIFGGTLDTATDILIGDNGIAWFNTVNTPDASKSFDVSTTVPAVGGNDIVDGGLGDDLVLGGSGNDTLRGGLGSDVILGDNGYIWRETNLAVSRVETSDPANGGNDIIDQTGFAGGDIVFGGSGDDQIYGGSAVEGDVFIGDNGVLAGGFPLIQPDLAKPDVNDIYTKDGAFGGADRIEGSAGADSIIGGSGNDIINGNGGDDFIFGDGGYLDRNASGTLVEVKTWQPEFGGNDQIDYLSLGGALVNQAAATGNDLIFGGSGNDTIDAGLESITHRIFGDNGRAPMTAADRDLYSTDETYGGQDKITGSPMPDIIIGGGGGSDAPEWAATSSPAWVETTSCSATAPTLPTTA